MRRTPVSPSILTHQVVVKEAAQFGHVSMIMTQVQLTFFTMENCQFTVWLGSWWQWKSFIRIHKVHGRTNIDRKKGDGKSTWSSMATDDFRICCHLFSWAWWNCLCIWITCVHSSTVWGRGLQHEEDTLTSLLQTFTACTHSTVLHLRVQGEINLINWRTP